MALFKNSVSRYTKEVSSLFDGCIFSLILRGATLTYLVIASRSWLMVLTPSVGIYAQAILTHEEALFHLPQKIMGVRGAVSYLCGRCRIRENLTPLKELSDFFIFCLFLFRISLFVLSWILNRHENIKFRIFVSCQRTRAIYKGIKKALESEYCLTLIILSW